jgi:hypothetical protein
LDKIGDACFVYADILLGDACFVYAEMTNSDLGLRR